MRILLIVLSCLLWPLHALAGVNAIIGDDSYIARFGTRPGAGVDEDLRLRVHLEYVEKLLRAADTSALSGEQRASRARMLDLLHAYHVRGVFPRNESFSERRPHFIDANGRICAVGYLIEQTAGRAAAEAINAKFEWAYLLDMDDPALAEWARASGLSAIELAMIQPSYEPPPDLVKLGAAGFSRQRILESLDRNTEIQECADRVGLAASIDHVSVTVTQRDLQLSIAIEKVGNAAFEGCVREHLRVNSWGLGKGKTMKVQHTVPVRGGTAGKPLDPNEVAEQFKHLAYEWGICVDPAALGTAPTVPVSLRITADPIGKLIAIEVVTPKLRSRKDARECFDAELMSTPAFKGKRTTIQIDI